MKNIYDEVSNFEVCGFMKKKTSKYLENEAQFFFGRIKIFIFFLS